MGPTRNPDTTQMQLPSCGGTWAGSTCDTLKYRVGIVGLERQQQSTVLDRTLQLLVHLCFGLRRENLEIFADAIHASINEQLIQIYDGFFDFSLKYRVGIVGLERRQQIGFERRTKSGVGPTLRVTSTVELRTSTRELRNFRRCHPCIVGIVGLERQQQSTVLDRTLQLLVHLCFGLRRENLEIFADAIHASINEQLIQIYNSFFDFRLKYSVGKVGFGRRQHSRIKMLYRYNRLRETTTKSGIGPTFTVTSSVELWTSTETLEIFVDAFHASISEQLIQIYDFIFGFRLKCRVGRVGSGDDNKFGSWVDLSSYYFSCALDFDERT
ncbi:uncharacterized protein V1477_015567 [Vespula maculifrons]|uniref:Uncharacterized protein n=1 Tax=Vespula maculifrons TaxID=7453 RepID=A0ABD2BEK9_VESMC